MWQLSPSPVRLHVVKDGNISKLDKKQILLIHIPVTQTLGILYSTGILYWKQQVIFHQLAHMLSFHLFWTVHCFLVFKPERWHSNDTVMKLSYKSAVLWISSASNPLLGDDQSQNSANEKLAPSQPQHELSTRSSFFFFLNFLAFHFP